MQAMMAVNLCTGENAGKTLRCESMMGWQRGVIDSLLRLIKILLK